MRGGADSGRSTSARPGSARLGPEPRAVVRPGRFGVTAGISIGNDVTIDVSSANISTTNQLYVAIDNTAGTIGGDAAIIFTASGDVNAASSFFRILNSTNGGSSAGFIDGTASVDLTAGNLSVASLQTEIDNSNGGLINGNATIDMNISGTATVTNDATVAIYGSDGAASAAINFNGGSYDAGGTPWCWAEFGYSRGGYPGGASVADGAFAIINMDAWSGLLTGRQ
jgi:hypothetical protein